MRLPATDCVLRRHLLSPRSDGVPSSSPVVGFGHELGGGATGGGSLLSDFVSTLDPVGNPSQVVVTIGGASPAAT